jgi:TonB family protein
MSPVSLLFSSDEQSSRPLIQALRELELEIEPCPDVFTAVEWLTSRSFDVVVADWDSGPEAAFLLANARKLKLNKAAFTVAMSTGTSGPAAAPDSPDLVLTKPLIPDQVKYALLSNDRFLGCLRAWVARGDFAHPKETSPSTAIAQDVDIDIEERPRQPSPTPLAPRPVEPSSAPGYRYGGTAARLNLSFATLDRELFRTLNHRKRGEPGSGEVKRYSRSRFLWGGILSLAFVFVGYNFGEPLRVQSVFASVATAYKKALQTNSNKPLSPLGDPGSDSAATAQAGGLHRSVSARYQLSGLPGIHHAMLLPEQISTAPAETLQANSNLPVADPRVLIPESLTMPQPEATTVRNVSLRRSTSLLSQVEPVNLPEDLSQALLLQRVPPSYPEQALKAGLQGAVILQAWIGKDGNIRDLKLVDGSLLLGQAAVKAVKQWRYKPYLRNGIAVEAETYVTVNFRLP